MPRIIPEQLLNCLKVLLDKNGGILSVSEVKRLAGLMTKYSKKLVSKCIYVLILKNTKTELLGEFMAAGGWSLVYTWLNDAIRAMNWPLVQEILELLLLCPVDINRLKINSSPKLVKGLCKDGGTEGVRILARCLVDQWLKIVTENNAVQQDEMGEKHKNVYSNSVQVTQTSVNTNNVSNNVSQPAAIMTKVSKQTVDKAKDTTDVKEEDPLGGLGNTVDNTNPSTYKLTAAQRKASEQGLVFKIVVKDGQQTLSKVPNPTKIAVIHPVVKNDTKILVEEHETNPDDLIEEVSSETNEESESVERASDASGDKVDKINNKTVVNQSKSKVSSDSLKNKKERSSVDLHDKKDVKDDKGDKVRDKDKEKDKDKDKKRKVSSSSSGRKSSELSSSSKSKNPSSSTVSSSSSSTHKSSKDRHRSSSKSSSSSSRRDKDKKEGDEKHRSSSSKPSSSSSSSSSKNRSKESSSGDKDKERSSVSSSSSSSTQKKPKESSTDTAGGSSKEREEVLAKMLPSISKLGRIPKKVPSENSSSINISSKKASISIEVRKDTEKGATVKTYKSNFRSHGLNEEAPPPPSRKSLKKSTVPSASSSTTPLAAPVVSQPQLKRLSSSPPHEHPVENKKSKIDLNSLPVGSDKPGAIKLIPAKKIATLVETNIFSDALLAATGPKKNVKRKRSTEGKTKDTISPPTSPTSPTGGGKSTALKFYQDTLDEAKGEDKSNVQQNSEDKPNDNKKCLKDDKLTDKEKDNSLEDDDIPLKRVKEDIDNRLQSEKEKIELDNIDKAIDKEEIEEAEREPRKPGPGCGPDGPPGVLLLHRRKGPKKKLTWRPQENLEQIRYFELDETERVNVTKTSFLDMKNMEKFKERDAMIIARRGVINEDNMEPQTTWRPLVEVEDVVPHPNGNQSKQRKIQADREMTTLRALYFATEMIPDAPVEADLEPHSAHDVPIIPLEDLTGNPDAVNNYTNMPWPEPKGSPRHGDNSHSGTGGLVGIGGHGEIFPTTLPNVNESPFNVVGNSYATPGGANTIPQIPMQPNANIGGGLNNWPIQMGPFVPNNAINVNNAYNSHMGNNPQNMGVPNAQNFGQFGPGNGIPYGNNNGQPFGQGGFNGPNFRPLGPGPVNNGHMMNGPMGNMGMMNGPMGNGPMMNNGPRNNIRNNNMGGNWRGGPGNNFDNNGNNNGGNGGPWRSAGSGPNRGNMGNNGICKQFMRGHCRLGKSCKFLHPQKSKRL